jgi:hypothetical protein
MDNIVEISTAEELQNVRYETSENYKLVSDIDASGIDNFRPIGYDGLHSNLDDRKLFEGTFDGNGYKISNVTICRPNIDSVGLFNACKSAVIKNLVVDNISVIGEDYTGSVVGAISGGRLHNIEVNGSVDGSEMVGGLAGRIGDETSVINCHTYVNVNGDSRCGGLVGTNMGTILESSSGESVIGDGDKIGGLVGRNLGFIEDSSSHSYCSGQNQVGGLTGTSQHCIINRCYATGDVQGSEEIGGLMGWTIQVLIENTFTTGDVQGNNLVGGLVGVNQSDIRKSYSASFVKSDNIGGCLIGKNKGKLAESHANQSELKGLTNICLSGCNMSSITDCLNIDGDKNTITNNNSNNSAVVKNLFTDKWAFANNKSEWTILGDKLLLKNIDELTQLKFVS